MSDCSCTNLYGDRWDGKGTQVIDRDCVEHGLGPVRQWKINLWDADAFVVEARSEDDALRAAVDLIASDPVQMLVAVEDASGGDATPPEGGLPRD